MSSESFELTCPVPITETDRILLGHGSGGRLTARLIDDTILPALTNPLLAPLEDAATLELGGHRIAMTTDSYVVTPLFFPGGDIGELAVNGTINDLAVSGAEPLALSLSLILEEGFPLHDLRRILASIQRAALAAGVFVATGDTKVVDRGKADGLFVNTTGIGRVRPGVQLGARFVEPGDAIVLSGPIGDHGITILSRRLDLDFGPDLASDTAPLHEVAALVLAASPDTHAMRDPTRGGLAATLTEIASRRRVGILVDEASVPVSETTRGAAEILGLDPFHVANEGKLVAFVPSERADAVVATLRTHPLGERAARIGTVTEADAGLVTVRTSLGSERLLDLPFAEVLPRIC
jgi:hydrogenase expression/formation protein HypE